MIVGVSRSDHLIDATALAESIAAGTQVPTVLDVRWRIGSPSYRSEYLAGHIPGAIFVDFESELSSAVGDGSRGRHPLPDAGAFQSAMRRAGVSGERLVVVYDERDSTAAGRAWWLLRYFGHANTRVLDGGMAAWTAEGYPLDPGDIAPDAGDFEARPAAVALLQADEAARLARAGLLLDARAGERYRGETEPLDPVAGHIPGAVSAPTSENLADDGRFLAADALRERFRGLGVEGAPEVGVYCGSGITAAHELLALAIAGFEGPALYGGSWSEWVADRSRPVATGSDPG
jgi:thiosulfate/3-mercaptopyruvate sulfurtransferase